MPFYADGRLEPRPVTLRAFAMRTRSGWTVMPGGFARVGASRDTAAIAMQQGGRAADVWILERRAGRAGHAAACPARRAVDAKLSRHPAQPRRRQSLLARPLYRARRGHGARPARLSRPPCRGIPIERSRCCRCIRAGLRRHRHRRATQPIPDALVASIDAAAAQRRAHPRPLLARRLAGAHGPVQDRPPLPGHGQRRATTRRGR